MESLLYYVYVQERRWKFCHTTRIKEEYVLGERLWHMPVEEREEGTKNEDEFVRSGGSSSKYIVVANSPPPIG